MEEADRPAEKRPDEKAPADAVTVPGVGKILAGKYRVEEVLGRGGMGIVLGARHTVLGHRVAIKLLATAAKANPTQLARFLREARATLELKSEHVVRVIDEGEMLPSEGGLPFLVMEHLDGADLHRVLSERGPLPIQEAVEYVLEACDAMIEAHARGIVHRDLKPSNLFLTRRGDGRPLIKVLDFGISKLLPREAQEGEGELTETLAVLGSPGYMAPEQIRSARHADHRADVWGFGVVLFRLLTRKPAFEGEGPMGICAAILSDPPKPIRSLRPEVPEELGLVIERCMEKDPARRFQSVTDLARALAIFAPDSPTAARFRQMARSPVEHTLDAPIVADAATNAAVTGQMTQTPRSRWPYAVAVAALLGGIAVFALRTPPSPAPSPEAAGVSPPTPPSVPASSPASAPAPASASASASVSAPALASSSVSAPALASSSVSAPALASSSASKPATKKPIGKPATKKPWGSTIDDPL